MAKVTIKTTTEGMIDKFDAFRALSEELGLQMLTGNDLNKYKVCNGVLYKYINTAYGEFGTEREVVSEDYRTVTLFESLLTVKGLL